MIKEARGFGSTVNEAKENAIANLGAGIDDDIQFEVITTPKKKILGLFGGCKAEVRVYVEKPDNKKRDKKQPKKKNNPQNGAAKPEQKKNEKTDEQKKVEKNAKTVKPAKKEEPVENTVAKENKATEATVASDDYKDAVDASQIPADSQTGRAIAYLQTILTALGCTQTTIKAAVRENGAFIVLDGEDLGVIIGHRGETLDSLQYLTSLAANSGSGYFKISLNIGNYREKREQTLIALANRVSQQVLRTGRSRGLEPMNPYERRIIHTAVQNIEGVVSNSVGEGDRRRVIIAPENGDSRPPRRDLNGGRRNNRSRKPSATVASEPSREPKKDSDVPLYGKIN